MSAEITQADVAEIVARIESGVPAEHATRHPFAPGEHLALQRAAVPRTFDRNLFEAILALESGPSLDELVATTAVEPVPGTEATYRVRKDLRDELQSAWWPDGRLPSAPTSPPPELVELLEGLVEHHRAGHREIEALEHMVILDPRRAAKAFIRLYDAADRRFDLAGCQDVISAVGIESRPTLVGPELRALVQDRMRYLRVRGDHAADYYRTARFFAPPRFDAEVENLLEGRGSRVVQIVAEGGMGKTMRIRWLISRKCIPERIPIARVDLDDVDPVVAASDPWLVLLEFALQLHDQLPGNLFDGLAKDFGQYRPFLRRGVPHGPGRGDLTSVRGRAATEVPTRIGTVLRETIGDGRIVLIIDTTEELVVPIERDLASLWEQLRVLHDQQRGLRLMVAGRYDLADRLPAFHAAFPRLRTRHLRPFTGEQSAEYLRMRGVRDESVIREMVRKSRGRPFKLALFADIASQDPGLQARDVRAYPEPDLLFLVDRVVDRISDPGVQWLLRYGVVPRRLTIDLATGPLAPLIARGMRGDAAFDDPRRDHLPASRRAVTERFATIRDSDAEPDVGKLWQALRTYAADASWVSMEDPTTLRFQPEVVEPMRRILRDREAWPLVHGAVAQWFETLARSDDAHWGELTAEAAYHRFQRDGDGAVPWLLRQLDEARARGHEDWVRRLVDEARRASPDAEPRVGVAVSRVVVDFELVALDVEAAGTRLSTTPDTEWSTLRGRLDRVVAADANHAIIPSARLAELDAIVSLGLRQWPAADAAIERGLALEPDARQRVVLTTLKALAREAAGRPDDGALSEALSAIASFALRRPDAGLSVASSVDRLAAAARRGDRLMDAIRVHDAAAEIAPDPSARIDHDLAVADLSIQAGLPGQALERLERIGLADAHRGQWVRRQLYQARAELASLRPSLALRTAERVLDQLTTDVLTSQDLGDVRELQAMAHEVRGEACAALTRVDEALTELDQARSVRAGWDVEGGARALVGAVIVLLRIRGDLNQARQLLEGLQSAAPARGGDAWTDGQLARAEWSARTGDRQHAAEVLNETRRVLVEQAAGPHRRIRAAAIAVTLASDEERGVAMDGLLAALADVDRPELRRTFLGGLAWGPSLEGVTTSQGARLVEHTLTRAGPLTEQDRTLATLADAELERVVGRGRLASERLRGLLRALVGSDHGQALLVAAAIAAQLPEPELALGLLHAADGLPPDARPTPLQRVPVLVRIAATLIDEVGVHARLEDARVLLAEAAQGIADDRSSALTASVRATEARLLDRLGDRLAASEAARSARETYTALGDHRAADEVLLPIPALGQEGPDDGLVLQIGRTRDGVEVRLRYLPIGDQGEPVHTSGAPLANVEDPDAPPEKVHGDAIAQLVTDVAGYQARLGSLLPRDALEHLLGITGALGRDVPPVRFAIEVTDRLLQPIPWELATLPGRGSISLEPGISALSRSLPSGSSASETVRYVQQSLARLTGAPITPNGLHGPQTREALAKFQVDVGLNATGTIDDRTLETMRGRLIEAGGGRLRSVILRTSTAVQYASQTQGLESALGIDLERIHQASGFQSEVVESADLSTLVAVLGDRRNSIVHIAAAIRITSGGVLSLDLFSNPDASSGPELTASMLGRVLTSDWGDPLVIIDVPRPSSPTEAARQLFLRNRFAADLFEQRVASAVIATGLMDAATLDSSHALLRALAEGRSVGQAGMEARRVLATDTIFFGDATAAAAIAVFARSPEVGLSLTAATGARGPRST